MKAFNTESHEAHTLRDFLEANWSKFSGHCEEFADSNQTGEELTDVILAQLGGE